MSDNQAKAAREGLGRAIEVRRVHLGLKRKDLAGNAGLSYPYISELENGGKEPSAKALRQIADALQISVAELVSVGEHYQHQNDEEPTESALHRWVSPSLLNPAPAEEHREVVVVEPKNASLPHTWNDAAAQVTAETESATSWGPPENDDELARLVAAAVRNELHQFVENDLPELVARELQRAIANISRSGDIG